MSKKRLLLAGIAVLLGAFAFIAIACGDDDDNGDNGENGTASEETTEPNGNGNGDAPGNLLDEVLANGTLECGVNNAVPGFGFVEPDGSSSGFDVEFCRAFAAALFGDADAVAFTPLTAEARLTALQTGQIDVLSRNTTMTITRDAATGLAFATTTFYDGQGMMVRADGGFESVDDLANADICVLQGTTTELNLADRLPDSSPIGFEDNDTLQAGFIAGRCEGWTSDRSQLAALRSAFPEGPEALVLLDEVFSKEPLGPLTVDNQSAFFDVINWTVIGMILADEMGITADNLDDLMANPAGPEMARLLGVAFEGGEIFDSGLGIRPEFMQDVIRLVGNYGEVYDENVAAVIDLPREGTQNASANDGGLIYAPPWR